MINLAHMSEAGHQRPFGRKDIPPAAAMSRPNSAHLPRKPVQPFSMVPSAADPDFVDRQDIIEWLHDATTLSCSRMALVGPSGVGKSQIAAQFSREIRRNAPGTFVFWVNARSRARLEESYQSIAELLHIPGRSDPKMNVSELVDTWFRDRRHGPWLMVLDNFDDTSVLTTQSTSRISLHERLLSSSASGFGAGSILFTSQNQAAVQRIVNRGSIYQVPPMTKGQALQILGKVPRHSYHPRELEQLPETLQNLPLVLNLAATYMQRSSFPKLTSEYVENFLRSRTEHEGLLGDNSNEIQQDACPSHATIMIWQTTFDKVQSERPSAADLLFLMSYFDHQDIPRFLLKRYADDQEQEERDFLMDIDILLAYKLVTLSSKGDIIMHSLIHACTRTRLPHGQRWKRMFLSCIAKEYPSDFDMDWAKCQKLDPHLKHIVDQPPVLDDVVLWSKLVHNIGTYWRLKKKYQAVERLAKTCLNECEGALGHEHRETLLTMRDLAVALRCQGKYKEAEKCYMDALEKAEETYGEDHPDTRFIRNEYARALKSEGRQADAQRLYESNLKPSNYSKLPPIFPPPRRRKLSTGSAPDFAYKPGIEFDKSFYGAKQRIGTSEYGSKRHSRAESFHDFTLRSHHSRSTGIGNRSSILHLAE